MLRPQHTAHRTFISAAPRWTFRPDPDDVGVAQGWASGFTSDLTVAVPGSWNEQLAEAGLMHHVGPSWYRQVIFVPPTFGSAAFGGSARRVLLRIGAASHHTTAWINGQRVGTHQGGFLPFAFDVTEHVTPGTSACVVLRVDPRLDAETIPQGIRAEEYAESVERGAGSEHFPPTRYDFFPYGGIHRPVTLLSVPTLRATHADVRTRLHGATGAVVEITVEVTDGVTAVKALLSGEEGDSHATEAVALDGKAQLTVELDEARLWSPEDPFLYSLTIHALDGAGVTDAYDLRVGIREVTVERDGLLLNGEPIFLRGFGKHEDAPVLGKAFSMPFAVKDMGLLRWMGANSFRTAHYPYAEAWLDLADEHGILVIDEVPAVSLNLHKATAKTQARHEDVLRALIRRDRNHPSVIMWALGNEPGLAGEEDARTEVGRRYWKPLFETARKLDPTRPLTVPNCAQTTLDDAALAFCDVISLNRYYGWYTEPGQLDRAADRLRADLEEAYERYGRPIFVSEFGADTMEGLHATFPQLFTEEYQADLIDTYLDVIEALDFTCGAHVWNFADFLAPQNFRRVVLNRKGVFNRTRDPKQAAFRLRARWNDAMATPRDTIEKNAPGRGASPTPSPES